MDVDCERWLNRVIGDTETAINTLLDEFLSYPYLHRVEHSLHCELYYLLMHSEYLSQLLDWGAFQTRAVHKEWPEQVPVAVGARRANHDLAILAPDFSSLPEASLAEYCVGRIKPIVVIELGLDYGIRHLHKDVLTLKRNGVARGYIVHFDRRNGRPDEGLEAYIRELMAHELLDGIRVAYACVTPHGRRYRRLGDTEIKSL